MTQEAVIIFLLMCSSVFGFGWLIEYVNHREYRARNTLPDKIIAIKVYKSKEEKAIGGENVDCYTCARDNTKDKECDSCFTTRARNHVPREGLQYRPYKTPAEATSVLANFIGTYKDSSTYTIVCAVTCKGVILADGRKEVSFEELFYTYKFLDNKPCGIPVPYDKKKDCSFAI